jgi:hypothetical protein
MRAILAGLTVVAMGVAGGAMSLAVGSSAQWVLVDVPSLNTFVRLTNETIAFVNDQQAWIAPVPFFPDLRGGIGLRLAQSLGGLLRVGLRVEMMSIEGGVQGAWATDETSHPVDIRLEAGLVALSAELGLALVPDFLLVTVSAGWGSSRIRYRCVFPRDLPTEWQLAFLPKAADEETAYTADGPVGGAAVQLTLPLGRGVSAGIEVGLRFAAPTVPRAGTAVLDLNADGMGDVVQFTGPWLGLTVRMEFSL